MRSSLTRGANDATGSNQIGLCCASALVMSAVTLAPSWARAGEGDEADQPSETIVVVDSLDGAREDAAASASVVTPARTPRSNETMADLLEAMPGVSVSRLGGTTAPALLSMRGSTWEQVSVYVDGVHLNVAAGGPVDLSLLPIGDVARVEVYRGATPIAYGGSAIGGVVSIETRRPEVTGATLEAGGGSFGTAFGGATASAVGDRYGLYAGLHTLRTAGDFEYLDDKGTAFNPDDDERIVRRNNKSRALDGALRGYLTLPGGRELSVTALGFVREQGLPGHPRYATMRSQLTTRRGIATVAYSARGELGATSSVRAQLYGYGLEQRLRDPLGELGAGPSDARDRSLALGGVARARWAPASWLSPAALVDVRRESFTPVDLAGDQHGGTSTRITATIGAEAAVRVAAIDLAILPSLRLETLRDATGGRDNFGRLVPPGEPIVRTQPIARLGVTQAPSEHVTLRANLGRYVRAPSFLELYGNSGFVRGNRELSPERGITADLGAALGWKRGDLRIAADAAGFAVLTEDLIQFQQSNTGISRARNIGRARVLGIESTAELRYRSARLYAQATFADAIDDSASAAANGKQLPYRPRAHVTLRPELRGIAAGGAELGGYFELDVTSGNYIDAANLVRVPSRARVGAGVSLGVAGGRARLILRADNLTGASESDLLSFPLPGRAVFFTLALATEPEPKERSL